MLTAPPNMKLKMSNALLGDPHTEVRPRTVTARSGSTGPACFAANVGYNAPHARRVSLLDKVLAETNATDRAKEYEIARNEVRHAIRHYVSESGAPFGQSPHKRIACKSEG